MLIDVYDVLVSEDNPYFTYEDDILYNKDKTKVIYCFHRSGNVTIPSSVSIIGSKAFYNLNLFSITILGEKIVIGSKAFENCEYLDILNIMGSLKTIGTEAFKYSSLSNINVEAFDENFKASSFAFAYSMMELYKGVYYFSCNYNKYYFAFATSNNKEKIILHKDNKYICSDLLQINKEVYLFDDTKV